MSNMQISRGCAGVVRLADAIRPARVILRAVGSIRSAALLVALAATLTPACIRAPAPLAPAPAHPGASTTPNAGLPPLLDRELFLSSTAVVRNARISPDGRFLAFIRPVDGISNVWVRGLHEPWAAARPVTGETARSLVSYFWSADGRYLLYTQDRQGNERNHLFAVDLHAQAGSDGSYPVRDLTPYEGIGVQVIAIPQRGPGSIIVAMDDREPFLYDIYRLELDTGIRTLIFQGRRGMGNGFVVDRAGNLRLGMELGGDGSETWFRIDGQQTTPVLTCEPGETCWSIGFHPDGQRVYFGRTSRDADLAELVMLDVRSGAIEVIESDPEAQVDLEGAILSRATGELLATYYTGDRIRVYPRDAQFQRDLDTIRKVLPRGDLSFSAPTHDDRYWLVVNEIDTDMRPTYLYDRATGSVELLYRPQPAIPVEHMAEMHAVRYTARDGLEIPGYLVLPQGVEPRGLPTIVLVHGGPFGRDVWGWAGIPQLLANRGYAVLMPNYRGSAGYGKRFMMAGYRQWGTAAIDDVVDGALWLVQQDIADPKRIAVMGASWGGYATLAALAFHPHVFAAGIDYFGPSSLITRMEHVPPQFRDWYAVRFGDVDDPADREMLRAQSPLHAVEQIRVPLLVVQGANDARVPKAESDQIVVALRDLGRAPEYLVAADEGHGFANTINLAAAWAVAERFLARHLGGRYQEEVSPELRDRIRAMTVDVDTLTLQHQRERPPNR
jgi:dipeptidyl aminopeptidase/acylaminoacyl peptidase